MARDVLGRRLPHVDLGAGAAQPLGEVLLERRLLSRRNVDSGARLGVEADERAGELDDVVPAPGDRLDQGALVGVEVAGVEPVVAHRRVRDSVSRKSPTYHTRNASPKPTVTASGRWYASGSPSGATRSASSASGREIRSQLFQRSTRPR